MAAARPKYRVANDRNVVVYLFDAVGHGPLLKPSQATGVAFLWLTTRPGARRLGDGRAIQRDVQSDVAGVCRGGDDGGSESIAKPVAPLNQVYGKSCFLLHA